MAGEITDDILFSGIRAVSGLLKSRQISPVALAEAFLDRLDKFGGKLGAVVTVTRDLARQQAKAAEAEIAAGKYRGPLHGVPFGAKDLLATRGIPTTWGAEPYRNQVFDYDATVITRLRDAGAVLVAKLSMVELAGGFGYNNADASFTGPGRTPWNLDYWSGGSSSGPGAAVAAGLVPFAIGSETSGSIINPAAFCGISGLRPTYGRVSRHGAMTLSWTLDKLGPMCRSADDCGLVLAAIAGADPLDPSSADKPFKWTDPQPLPKDRKPRVGVIRGTTAKAQPQVRENFEKSLKVLSAFAEVVDEVVFPELPFDEAVDLIVNSEGASAFRDLLASGKATQLRAENDKWGGYAAAMIPAVDYLQAMRARGPMKRALDELYSKYDALVCPSEPNVALPIDRDFEHSYPGIDGGPPVVPAGNLAGQPALSVPNGFGENGLPTGIQFTGRAWSEATLLQLAHACQQATDWHTKRPPL